MKTHTRSIVRNDFLLFAQVALRELDGTEMSDDRYLELLASELMRLADGSSKRLLINLPPRHLKTQLCTICFAAWLLAQRPQEKILIVSYSQELAEDIARAIRKILQAPWFKKTFETRIAVGHAKINNFATTVGGQLYAASIDGSLTGFGANIIIVDDPHNLADAGSPCRLQMTIERFHSIVVQRLNNRRKGRILVVGHRLHDADLSADLLETGAWRHLALPIVAPKDKTYETAFGRWKRREGTLLRPDADDIAEVKDLRRKLVNPSFELLYQQGAEARALPAITADHFAPFNPADVASLPHFISVDPGMSSQDNRSFSVAQLWASDGVNFFLVELFRERCDFIDLAKAIRRLSKPYGDIPILIEATANGPALLSALTRKQRRNLYPIVPRDAKTVRFRRHVEKILAGRVRVPRNASFIEKFFRELAKFPHGHDDQVDAMTQFMDWLERQEETDFSKPNFAQRPLGVRTREPDYGASIPTRLPQSEGRNPPSRGLAVIAKPQLYNPPFPEVKAWVTY